MWRTARARSSHPRRRGNQSDERGCFSGAILGAAAFSFFLFFSNYLKIELLSNFKGQSF